MKTAVIIGAGPAGLTAAYYLLKNSKDIHPIILEAEAYIGGIARTVNYKGNRMDIGGHRFFSKNQEIMDLWQELLPVQGEPAYDDKKLQRELSLNPKGPDPEQDDSVMLLRHRVSRIFYLRKFFDYPIKLSLLTIRNLGFCRMLRIIFGYLLAMFHKLPEVTLADFIINRFGKPLYETFFKDYTYKVWGKYPEEIGADWGSQRIKGLSLKKALLSFFTKKNNSQEKVETSLIEEFYYPKYGPGQLWDKMKEEILSMGGEIHLNNQVNNIQFDSKHQVNCVSSTDSCGNSKNWQCDYLISSMPINYLFQAFGNIHHSAATVAQNLPFRDFITVGLLVKRLKIVNKTRLKTLANIVPDCWIYVQEADVKIGRIQIFNNWSPYLVQDPENTVWLGLEFFCNEGDSMWNMPQADFIERAVNELVIMEIIEADAVLDSTYLQVKKAYPAYFGSYKDFGIVREYLDGIGNLYCIGRNGQHRYNNMDHSMLTAIEAGKAIINGAKSKADIWDVNTENTYHEAK